MRRLPGGEIVRSTTILCVSHRGKTVMAGDGQVTFGATVIKGTAEKSEPFTTARYSRALPVALPMLSLSSSVSRRSSTSTRAKWSVPPLNWQRIGERTEACAGWKLFLSSRTRAGSSSSRVSGDVIEPDDGIASIGSGGPYAKAAALALKRHSNLNAEEIAREALTIAADLCIYTNTELVVESLDGGEPGPESEFRTRRDAETDEEDSYGED